MSSSQGLHSLATIIKRLEAATSRLEDIASVAPQPGSAAAASHGAPAAAGAPPPPPPPPPPPAAAPVQETPKSVVAFDETVIGGPLKAFVDLTNSFAGKTVVDMVALVEKQFQVTREIILTASACKKPDQKAFESVLLPKVQGSAEELSRFKEANRKERDWYSHLTVLAEAAPLIGWVANNPKPAPYVGDIKEMTAYYGNKLMKEFKEKDAKHVEWVKAHTALLDELRKYIQEHHTTGLTWNSSGVDLAGFSPASQGSSAGGAPPPPPPPPAPVVTPAAPAGGSPADVFAALNRGAEVTKGLRKVDKSEMTHKNPALRQGSVVPSSPSAGGKKPTRPMKPQALMGKKPSKLALDGKNWTIEYFEDDRSLAIEDGQLSQAVNVFGCKNCTIQIKGKVNAVTLVNCTKVSVLVESVVSSISVTKSPSFALQVTGTAPMIQLDSTDSGQIYLSKSSLEAEISTAKCSSINVSLPVEGEEEGVFEEKALPEMLKTVVVDGKLVTTIVEHMG